jgi:NADH-quinone oxidoreductase subunit I
MVFLTMNAVTGYIQEIFHGLRTLWAGMRITGSYFVSPREIITQKYPENRNELKMFERFKGEVIMPHDENNQHRCTGCGICQINCPNGSIEVFTRKEMTPEGKEVRVIDRHVYYLGMCTFCGLCVKTCPSDALAFGQDFEHSVFDRGKLTRILNKPGSSIKKEEK